MEDRVVNPRKSSLQTLKPHFSDDPELSNASLTQCYRTESSVYREIFQISNCSEILRFHKGF